MFRSTNLREFDSFASYLGAVSNDFCPFIKPAQEDGVLLFSEYYLKEGAAQILEEDIFYIGILHTELLRKERRVQKTRRAHDLFSENILFRLPKNAELAGPELFAWPHWLLKLLYTKVSIMFGKFWEGEQDTSRDGRQIPIPPNNFLSIRSAIKPIDIRFFTKAPQLTDEHIYSCDSGESVFGQVTGMKVPYAIMKAELLDPFGVTADLFLQMVMEMRKTQFYTELRLWGQDLLVKQQ
ncbi:MAG: hypothetical protein AAB975_04050 [Patescibacteria group bacterium]